MASDLLSEANFATLGKFLSPERNLHSQSEKQNLAWKHIFLNLQASKHKKKHEMLHANFFWT